MAHSYHALFGIDVSIVRYFTVFGPAGRPDLSIFRFIQWIQSGTPLQLFGDGSQARDFTYVDDVAAGTIAAARNVGFEVINLGNNQPHTLSSVIEALEGLLGKKAIIESHPPAAADIKATRANIEKAARLLDWKPQVSLTDGLTRTVAWHRENADWLRYVKI